MAYSPLSILPHNDIHLSGNGLADVRGAEAVGQHVRQTLKFFKGECWLDTSGGVDWFGYVLGKAPQMQPIAESVVKLAILGVPDVTEITEFVGGYDRASRGLKMSRVSIKTTFDETVSIPL